MDLNVSVRTHFRHDSGPPLQRDLHAQLRFEVADGAAEPPADRAELQEAFQRLVQEDSNDYADAHLTAAQGAKGKGAKKRKALYGDGETPEEADRISQARQAAGAASDLTCSRIDSASKYIFLLQTSAGNTVIFSASGMGR